MQLLKRIDMVIEKAVEYFCIALLAAIIILCFSNTLMRYLFNSPIVWSEELTRYMSVWLAIVGSAATVRVDGHTALDILQGLVKNRKVKAALFILTRVIVVVILVGLFPVGIVAMQTLGRSIASSTRLPMWVLYLSFPLGSVCMVIAYIRTVPEYTKMILKGEKE